jgi:hypothetical protein
MDMRYPNSAVRYRVVLLTCVLIGVVTFSTGCISHVKELREAQDQFNRAADIENSIKSDSMTYDPLVRRGQADASYRLAISILSGLIEQKREDLRKDGLLGTAYMIMALAEWRTGAYDKAMNTVSEAKREVGAFPYARDQALMAAMPGLVKNDQAYMQMRLKKYQYQGISELLASAMTDIHEGIAKTQRGDGARIYLIFAEMAALKNWLDLRGEPELYVDPLPPDFNKAREIDAWCGKAKPVWEDFMQELQLLDKDRAATLKNYWGKLLTMPETCP